MNSPVAAQSVRAEPVSKSPPPTTAPWLEVNSLLTRMTDLAKVFSLPQPVTRNEITEWLSSADNMLRSVTGLPDCLDQSLLMQLVRITKGVFPKLVAISHVSQDADLRSRSEESWDKWRTHLRERLDEKAYIEGEQNRKALLDLGESLKQVAKKLGLDPNIVTTHVCGGYGDGNPDAYSGSVRVVLPAGVTLSITENLECRTTNRADWNVNTGQIVRVDPTHEVIVKLTLNMGNSGIQFINPCKTFDDARNHVTEIMRQSA